MNEELKAARCNRPPVGILKRFHKANSGRVRKAAAEAGSRTPFSHRPASREGTRRDVVFSFIINLVQPLWRERPL